ncbi:MAG TPA: alginate lyase family protein [bacterium]
MLRFKKPSIVKDLCNRLPPDLTPSTAIVSADDFLAITDLINDGQRSRVIEEAQNILKGRLNIYHTREIHAGQTINWHHDVLTNITWPKVPWRSIRLKQDHLGSIRNIWELNRHKHFVVLGKAYIYTNDKRFFNGFKEHFESWIRQNPYGIGVNWYSSLEIAMRAISWLWVYTFFGQTPAFAKIHDPFINNLYIHAQHIYHYRSEFLHPSNHNIGEAAALYMLCAVFPQFDPDRTWRKKARDMLEKEVIRQTYTDGGCKEQSFSYMLFDLDLLMQTLFVSERMGDAFSDHFVTRIEKMLDCLSLLAQPGNKIPMVGDSDNARGLPIINSCNFWQEEDLFCLGGLFFDRRDLLSKTKIFTESAAWLTGARGYKKYHTLKKVATQNSSTYLLQSGYFILRDNRKHDIYVLYDVGELGIGKVAGHGHDDLTSVVISINNNEFIIDPGTYTYSAQDPRRSYLRSTSAHNTILIDNTPRIKPLSSFDWDKTIKGHAIRYGFLDKIDFAEASYDYKAHVTHRRKTVLQKHGWIGIQDHIAGHGLHQVELNFHLSPEVIIVDHTGNSILCRNRRNYLILYVSNYDYALSVVKDEVSYTYGISIPSKTIKLAAHRFLPETVTTLFVPSFGKPNIMSEQALDQAFKTIETI